MFGSLGFPELLMIFAVALIIFGPRKLPEIGRTIGKAMGEFRRATNDLKSTLEEEVRVEETRRSISSSLDLKPFETDSPNSSEPSSSSHDAVS